MSDESTSTKHTGLRTVLLGAIAIGAFVGLSCAGCLMLLVRRELLATFTVGPYTIDIYAEPEFHYESPGYIYFELKQWGQARIPERRFMAIGPERRPSKNFTLIKSDDEEIVALVLSNEVQMIHEFSSGYTWPDPYTNVTESQWQIAEVLLQKLRFTNPDIRCSRQEWYRRKLDHREKTDG